MREDLDEARRCYWVSAAVMRLHWLKDEEALKDEQIKKLKQKVGELVLDLDILREAAKAALRTRTSGE